MKTPPRLGAALALLCASQVLAVEWPQYRGPNASGLDDSQPLPTTWNLASGENIRWQTPIPGLAHSSPIVWGDRVYVATAVSSAGKQDLKVGLYGNVDSAKDNAPQQWRLLALDKTTGKILWNVVGHESAPKVSRHTKATHCNSTPATDGKRIVAIFGSEGLFCFDAAEGKLLWKKDLGPMDAGWFTSPSNQWGFASSPIIHDGKVVVQCDVQKGSFLALFDLADGKELWRTPRDDVPTWGTPTMVGGKRTQIAVNGWHHSGGYDFATGRELWRHDGGGDIPVPTPIVAHDLIYFTSAHGRFRPMRAVRVDATGDLTPTDTSGKLNPGIAWEQEKRGNYMQTPIIVGHLLYGCADIGLLTCFEAKTGEVRYSERLANTPEGYTASPVSDGRHVYITSELGNVFVVPATDKFSIVAKNVLGETCLATPAVSDGALFFRTRDKLVAVGAQKNRS